MRVYRPYDKHTRTFKTHGKAAIELDFYLALLTSSDDNENVNPKSRPILLFFHGGYLVRPPLLVIISISSWGTFTHGPSQY